MTAHAAIQPFKSLDTETEDALRASIKRFGVVVPIVVDGMGRIIDGHHRARIAKELNLTCPQIKRVVRNDDDANALAYSLNADRRHMDREQRLAVIADLRQQGYSLRAIAGVVGVSHIQVRNDLAQADQGSGVNGLTPGEEEGEVTTHTFAPATVDAETGEVRGKDGAVIDRVNGRDGKSYPRKRPAKDPERTREAIEARWQKVAEMASDNYSSRQIATAVGMKIESLREGARDRGIQIPADATTKNPGGRSIDPNRVVAETVATVEGTTFALGVVPLDYAALDRESLAGWVSSLSESLRSLTTLKNNLKKELTRE